MPDFFVIAACGSLLLGAARVAAARLGEWRRRRRRGGRGEAAPLKRVVAMCEARWFLDELKVGGAGVTHV
jgi:hypothetical protein